MHTKLKQILQSTAKAHLAVAGKASLGPEAWAGPKWRDRLEAILAQACPRIQAEDAFRWVAPEDLWEEAILHVLLRSLGWSAMESLGLLLELAVPMDRVATFAAFLPTGASPDQVFPLLDRHGLHPLSVARQFCHRAKALRFLDALGLGAAFGPWIGPGGRLLIQADAQVRALPSGLLLRGGDRIADCPRLVDLG